MGIQVIPVIEELIFIPFWWALLSPPPPDPLTLLVVYYLSATPNNTYLHFNHKAQESLGYSFSHLLFPSELCVPRQCFPGVCVCVLHWLLLCVSGALQQQLEQCRRSIHFSPLFGSLFLSLPRALNYSGTWALEAVSEAGTSASWNSLSHSIAILNAELMSHSRLRI